MKKMTRKQKIRWSIIGGIIALVLVIGIIVFKQMKPSKTSENKFQRLR